LVPSFIRVLLVAAFSSILIPAAMGMPQRVTPVQAAEEKEEFFSGTAVEVTQERLTVSRTILGKPPESRTFIITPSTKIEGKLKENTRVTVRFAAGEGGDVALSILVRETLATIS
jgi:hypothetical protein